MDNCYVGTTITNNTGINISNGKYPTDPEILISKKRVIIRIGPKELELTLEEYNKLCELIEGKDDSNRGNPFTPNTWPTTPYNPYPYITCNNPPYPYVGSPQYVNDL